ncbi:MAG: AmmeMemoRadiSam system protein B [Myxococcota bacterium]
MLELPKLRLGLDVFPSGSRERPGIVVRDPFRYAETALVIPTPLVPVLASLDGTHTRQDLLRRARARSVSLRDVDELVSVLEATGYLEGEAFETRRRDRHARFRDSPIRAAEFAGSGYPESPAEIDQSFRAYREGLPPDRPRDRDLLAIAAPHLSPYGGPGGYGSAYRRLGPEHRDRTFVILGTSHYGAPDRFGLTKKQWQTPLGLTRADEAFVDALIAKAPASVELEDYCHAVEHSIEFQVVFLQHAVAPDVKIVPILCGSFFCGADQAPESRASVDAFIRALRQVSASRGDEVLYVLGIDLAHMGARYGDPLEAQAERGPMLEVRSRDHARLDRAISGDPEGFFRLAHTYDDELKWCGTTPIYTFLRAAPEARGQILHYGQWNIDEQSVVTYAGLEFLGR